MIGHNTFWIVGAFLLFGSPSRESLRLVVSNIVCGLGRFVPFSGASFEGQRIMCFISVSS